MKNTWILVADSGRARLFEAGAADARFTEIEDFANPEGRAGARGISRDRLPTVNESANSARHAIEPHTTPSEKVTDRFASELGGVLERGRVQNRFDRLILVAPARFLGALRAHLDAPLRNCVSGEIRRNLTQLPIEQIRARLPAHLLH